MRDPSTTRTIPKEIERNFEDSTTPVACKLQETNNAMERCTFKLLTLGLRKQLDEHL